MPEEQKNRGQARLVAPRALGVVLAGLSLAVALAIVLSGHVLLSALHNQQAHTSALFEHPFAVSNAALEARLVASNIRNAVLYALVSRDRQLVEHAQERTAELDTELESRLDVLEQAYLGDQEEVRGARRLLEQWRSARAEIIALALADDFEGARGLVLARAGPLHDQLVVLLNNILSFARRKAASFASRAQEEAAESERRLVWQFSSLAALIALIGPTIAWLLSRRLVERSEALRVQDEHFRIALDAAPTGMLAVDAAGRIDLVNEQVTELFGYTRDELLGSSIERLVPREFAAAHPGLRTSFQQHPVPRKMGGGRDVWAVDKAGRRFAVEVGLTPVRTPRGEFTLCSVVDVSERHRATERLQEMVQEKELLVREVHHRVKNNLQVISSLLSVQSRGELDPASRAVLEASRARVQSISLVHEMLQQSGTDAKLGFGEYLKRLVEQLAMSNGQPEISVMADSIQLRLEQAIPLGLVINELVTNAAKHGGARHIEVRLTATDHSGLLEVNDDGLGLPETPREGLGLRLVAMLARQLKGRFEPGPRGGPGARTRLSFEVA